MTLRCERCGGPVEVVDVNAGESSAFERYECVDCGSEGTYINEFGVPGGDVSMTGLVDR